MNSGSGEKRAGTLPIFARKRPRVALMAFSSSQNPVTTPGRGNTSLNTQEHVQDRSYFTPSEKENYQHHHGGNKPATSWRSYKPKTGGHMSRPPPPPPPAPPQPSIPRWGTSRDSFNDTASSIDLVPPAHLHGNQTKPLIKEEVNTSHNLLLKSVHMLTATSQGVQHWSKYQQQMTLVFEVYGLLGILVTDNAHVHSPVGEVTKVVSQNNEDSSQFGIAIKTSYRYCHTGTLTSPIQPGESGVKRFTLQAVDGPMNCLFWEIDYKIPASLVRGHLCRVVGTWDAHKFILKCVSVRPSDRKEFSCVKNVVSISDRYMRQTVLSLHET